LDFIFLLTSEVWLLNWWA